MGTDGLRYVPAALLLAIGLAVRERAWRRAVVLPAAGALVWGAGWVVPLWWPTPFTAIVSLAAVWLIRFLVAIGVAAHLVATTSPTQLSAGLRAWRVPRAVAVTLAMMLRFFPVVAAEAAAVLDAARLRGLAGPTRLLRHPILTVERITVPTIAASLRAGEDLSASAILRGMGSFRTPTSMHPPRLGLPDAVLVVVVGVLGGAAVLLPPPLS